MPLQQLRQMANIYVAEIESPTDSHYLVTDGNNLPEGSSVFVRKYTDGALVFFALKTLDTQVTLVDSDCDD